MPCREIECDTDGAIGYLTLNKPEKINVLSNTMVAEQALYEQAHRGDEKALGCGARTIALNGLAEDVRIGIQAFPVKANPEWKNRQKMLALTGPKHS
jgi:hypothetical protein